MKTLFTEQFRYNQWANGKLLAFIDEKQLTNNRINPIFSHLTLAQVIWCDRLHNKPTPQGINEWATWPWDEIQEKCLATSQSLLDYVLNHSDDMFDAVIDFVNTSGTPYSRPVHQVLAHVLQYTNFHRGQIVGLIHQNENLMTPSLDFIDFVNS
jgi:uncharacterized damage-inducible protein DinB